MSLKSLTPSGMAEFARNHTAFYRRFYSGHDTSRFEELPLLEKRMVRDVDPYDLLADTHRDKAAYYAETTGSSGSPTPAFYTVEDFHAARFLAMSSPHLGPLRKELKGGTRTCLNGMAFGFTVAGMAFGDVFQAMGGLVANVGSRSTIAPPPRIARTIARLKPVAIAATPIDFLSWMRIVKEDFPGEYDGVVSNLRLLLSSAELCAGTRAQRIAEHFGILHVDTYASVEGLFTLPCTCGEKHVLPAYHLELFDHDLEPLGGSGTGRLAFTNLVKRTTPMVRYLLDDWVTISRSACPHGFGLSIVPHGRYELNVEVGGRVLNVEHVENLLFTHGLFGDYRLRWNDGSAELIVEQYTDVPVPAAAIRDTFSALLQTPVQVSVVPFGHLTAYREVRATKPILKIEDRRSCSTQDIPDVL